MQVLAGGIGGLRSVASPYDLVRVLGVFMYLPESEPALAEVAGLAAAGGLVSVATRTRTSALWHPAARQHWAAAAAAFDEDRLAAAEHRDVRYLNEIGASARADDLDRLVGTAAYLGLDLERRYGVRTAVDLREEDRPPPADPGELATLLDVEDGSARSTRSGSWRSSHISSFAGLSGSRAGSGGRLGVGTHGSALEQ